MTPDEMRNLGLRVYQEVIEQGKLEVADELIAADCIDISPQEFPGVGRNGPEPLKQFATMMRSAFPDIRVRIHELLTDGDTGIARITFEGTHRGEFFGVPPTGKQIAFDAVDIVKIREGKVREHYGIADMLGLMQQLGVIPAPEQTGA